MAHPDSDLNFEDSRIALAALAPDAVVLCASQRLARNLRRDHDQMQLARGLTRWQPLRALIPAQWLEALLHEALLAGEIAVTDAPRLLLSDLQERILWDRAIAATSDEKAQEETLFDREGLAAAAAEANALMAAWNIRIPDVGVRRAEPPAEVAALQSEETRQFLRWREEFQRICGEAGWLEAARYFDWQINSLKIGAGRLPSQLALAGFDRYNRQETRLVRVLMQRGVAVYELEQGLSATAQASVVALPDRNAECRAAAAWARQQLALNPAARLGIVVPELGAVRETLAAMLDDALDPAAVNPALAEMPRRYNFSLGLPLARQPIVAVALQLLALAAQPRKIAQEEFTALLRQPYWSADVSEADQRARLDARMREFLPPVFSLERALRFINNAAERGLGIMRLRAHLTDFQNVLAAQAARQSPSAWALACEQLLVAAGWPGERTLSSHEYQARRAFAETLERLAELDAVLGRISLAEACRRLAQLCRERIFQPATEGDPPVQVMGQLEIADTPLDALWAMSINDHLWPPPPRPNPLLPAELQRRARAPGASAGIQGEFAAVIQRRLLRSAPQVYFSWARSEGGRELRPSPLIASTAAAASSEFSHASLIETLAGSVVLERIADAQAPPVAAGEAATLRGGTGLLRAQAICPAWAFYRYRLGAKALETPVEGLDAAARGTLLHAVLQYFWTGSGSRGSRDLQAMTSATRLEAVEQAVDLALQEFNATLEQALTPRFLALERERQIHLVEAWLEIEAQRAQHFSVIACEEVRDVEIEGIAIHLVVDRIDTLDDGRCVILDYKTGNSVSNASWGEARISEPQLPIYAALALSSQPVAAVAFAKVRLEECGFLGIAAEAGLLPKVAAITDAAARKIFPQQADWDALLAHWQSSIAAIAREIKAGEAAVRFDNEKHLAYCEVLPLLRLAERNVQISQFENE
ncbi:MAG: PD-(D/E)XK nuclease family protein [Betaproteobacteria bacterium]|nr:PD-(D/E)XK nuclease family protein [Betaproteobacteria bacterium]